MTISGICLIVKGLFVPKMKTRAPSKKRTKLRKDHVETPDAEALFGLIYGQFTLQQIALHVKNQTLEATKTAFKKRKHIS